MSEKFLLRVKTHFDAAHQLRSYEGKCNRLHGHRWEVEVVYEGNRLDSRNMLIDFKNVKSLLDDILNEYLDHHCLNKTLQEDDPTAEFLACWIYTQLRLNAGWPANISLCCVTVWESPDCCITYSRGVRNGKGQGTTGN